MLAPQSTVCLDAHMDQDRNFKNLTRWFQLSSAPLVPRLIRISIPFFGATSGTVGFNLAAISRTPTATAIGLAPLHGGKT